MKEKLEVLSTVYEYIEKSEKQICDVADLIRNGNGYENIPQFVEGITYIIKAFELTNDINNICVDLEIIENFIKDILEAMENEDFNLVADIFEYEFYPLLKDWKINLEGILKE